MTQAVRTLVSFRSDQARLVAYVSVAHGLVHTIELTYAALLSRIEAEFGGGFLALGAVANVFAFTFGASALPSGFLVDRFGSRRVLVGAFLAAAALSALVAFSPNVWWLAVTLGLLGLAIGLYHPAGISLIAQGAEQRSLAFGYHGVSGNLGIAFAPVLAVGLAVLFDDWRAAYLVTALLALAVVGTLRFLALPEGAGEAPSEAMREVRGDPAPALALLVVYAAFVLNGFVYRGSLTFIPTHLEDRLGAGDAWVGALTTAALLAGALGQLAGGALAERRRLERLVPLQALALAPGLVLIGALRGYGLVPVVAAFVFVYFAGQPIFTTLIAEYSPQNALGRSYGFTFFAAFGLGSGAATFAGFFADRWGTGAVFFALAAVAAATLALALVIWRYGERRPASLAAAGAVAME
ncbi:MAG TPA: MFS transporter [Dehalococcoidia bacterium]|nr:MFS transporter [Dehalococcoidia bacterium]